MGKGSKAKGSKVWSMMSLGATIAGATVARKGLDGGWKAATGKQPPANPADPDVDVWEAVTWAALSGTLVALAKLLATRRAANYYIRSTGHPPGQLQHDAAS